MADDRITGVPARYEDDTTLTRAERLAVDRAVPVRPIRDADHLLPAEASPGEPGRIAATDDPDVARAEIERTRARMSATIDHIESALLRKKEEVQQRLDVMAPVRERPLGAVAAVFGAGLVLGLLTGGGDDRRDDGDRGWERVDGPREGGRLSGMVPSRFRGGEGGWKARARSWEDRSRELQRLVRRQQEVIEEMRARLDEGPYRVEVDLEQPRAGRADTGYEGDFCEGPGSLRDTLLGGIADSIGQACDQWAAGDDPSNPRYLR